MSKTYPELNRTKFPDATDAFIYFKDPDERSNAMLTEYQLLISNKQFAAAATFLSNYPELEPYIVNADRLNHLLHAVMAIEQYYMSDVRSQIMEIVDYMDAWNEATAYGKFDVVTYTVGNNVMAFMGIVDDIPVGTEPTNKEYWIQLTLKGAKGDPGISLSGRGNWDPTVVYAVDNWVAHNGTIWASSTENINSEPHDQSEDWYAIIRDQQHYVISDDIPNAQYTGDIWYKVLEDGSIQPQYKQPDGSYSVMNFAHQMPLNIDYALPANWSAVDGLDEIYTQTIDDYSITKYIMAGKTRIDITADAATKIQLEEMGVQELWAENQNGTLVVRCRGDQPNADLAIQFSLIGAIQ